MKKLMVIIFFSWISLSWATNYYVDKNSNGSNNGTSWANAWQSFGDISWGSLGAGDTLFISGGSDGLTYTEELEIQSSGNAVNDLVIRAGLDAGHNGEVKIVRGRTGSLIGIDINGVTTKREYITVQKITITESTYGVVLSGNATGERINDITLDSLTITQWGRDGLDAYAIYLNGGHDNTDTTEHIDSVFITNCDISFIDTLDQQTDCVVAKFAQNLVIDNTSIYLDNRSYVSVATEPGHNDNIQVFGDPTNDRVGVYNLTVTNCTLTNLGGVDSSLFVAQPTIHCHIIQTEDNGGDYIIYNNTIRAPYFYGYSAIIYDKEAHWDDHKMIVIHNTITSRKALNMIDAENNTSTGTSPHIYKNNIFYSDTLPDDGSQYVQDDFDTGLNNNLDFTNWNQVDGNLYSTYCYQGGTNNIWYATAYRNSAYITSNGGESSGDLANRYLVDPLFVQYTRAGWPDGSGGTWDLHLQSGSPAIDEGADLQSYIEGLGLEWVDKDGKPRDSTPDCGAYQYDGPRGSDITPPEVTGATLLDSITLKIMFSEVLDETTAEDENNYFISNNIDIFNASLNGSNVTLQTSAHSPGSYIVTVVNVEDLAGNPIAQSDTGEYSLIPPDSLIMLTIEDVQGVTQEPGHTPLKTIDGLGALSGDPDSRWAAEPMPEELIFDLVSDRAVCKTKLSFYNWNYGRVYTYSILISSDNNNWVTIVSQATSASNEEWTIDEFPAVDARYVKVDFINNNQSAWAGLWEGEIWGIIPSVADPVNNGLPNEFALLQNYPNPFNPSTTISFSLPKNQFVKLSVFNILGEHISELTNQEYDAGIYTIDFDGSALASGIYFYRIETPEFVGTKKMILMQ